MGNAKFAHQAVHIHQWVGGRMLDLARQRRLNYVDFIPVYTPHRQGARALSLSPSFPARIASLLFRPTRFALYAAGLTSLRFLSRQFPNSVPRSAVIYGDLWLCAASVYREI